MKSSRPSCPQGQDGRRGELSAGIAHEIRKPMAPSPLREVLKGSKSLTSQSSG